MGIEGEVFTLEVQPVGHEAEEWHTTAYFLYLEDKMGLEHRVLAFTLESITANIGKVDIAAVADLFPGHHKVGYLGYKSPYKP